VETASVVSAHGVGVYTVNSIHYLRDEVAVVGWACRLPGAKSVTELWSLLLEGRCAVSQVPPDRFSLDRFGHPRRQERGKSYTFAAGVLDDLWGFDPTVFGISPREAEQMDPQQRILLQLTWEALEDAGIPPSTIAGTNVGVFVGASQADYGHKFFGDHRHRACCRGQPHLLHLRPARSEPHGGYRLFVVLSRIASGCGSFALRPHRDRDRRWY
jgi:acyl transferase domain-containing protein